MQKSCIFALTLAIVAVSCQKDVHQEVMHQDVVCVSNDDNGYEEVGDRPSYEDVCFDKTPSVLVYSF